MCLSNQICIPMAKWLHTPLKVGCLLSAYTFPCFWHIYTSRNGNLPYFSNRTKWNQHFRTTCIKIDSVIYLALCLVWMVRMLGQFLYFIIVFKVESLMFCTMGSKFEYWEILTFFNFFAKEQLKSSAVILLVLHVHHHQLSLF